MKRFESEQKTRMLQQFKQNLRQMEQGLTAMTSGLRVCTAAKIEVTADITEAITKFRETVQKVKSATDPEAIQDIDFGELPEIGDRVRETVEACHRLRQLPRITRQFTNDVRAIEREVARLRVQARRAKLVLDEHFTEILGGVTALKPVIQAVAQVKTADAFDDAMVQLEDAHGKLDALRDQLDSVRGVLNARQVLAEAQRELRNAQRTIDNAKRKKLDTAAAEQLLAEGRTIVGTIDTLSKQRPIDVDTLHDAFEKLEDLGDRAEPVLAQLGGRPVRGSLEEQFGRSSTSQLQLPSALEQFRREESAGAEASGGTGTSAGIDALFSTP